MRNSSPSPHPLPDDDWKMRLAIDALNNHRIRFTRPTKYQLKALDLNFYPNKGTIFRDSDGGALDEKGIDVFITLLANTPAQLPAVMKTADDEFDQSQPLIIRLHTT